MNEEKRDRIKKVKDIKYVGLLFWGEIEPI